MNFQWEKSQWKSKAVQLVFKNIRVCLLKIPHPDVVGQGTAKGGRGEGGQKKRWEDGRHQGMDRSGVHQVPKGSGEQRKMEETGCEVICGAPKTHAVKG